MSKHQNSPKKVATKPAKTAGTAKVPRYEQQEAHSDLAAPALSPKTKK